MQRPNRGYKRGEPFRDATLFVIASEGAVREKEYFEELAKLSSRVRIKVLEREEPTKSAPKWIIDSAAKYKEDVGLAQDDQLWIVIDVDRWKEDQLREISITCRATSNWNLALSNPCFEVWLYLHVEDIRNSTSTRCQELKTELNTKLKGGYNKVEFVRKLKAAHDRSISLDPQPHLHFMPEAMRSKMHLLTTELFKIVGSKSVFTNS